MSVSRSSFRSSLALVASGVAAALGAAGAGTAPALAAACPGAANCPYSSVATIGQRAEGVFRFPQAIAVAPTAEMKTSFFRPAMPGVLKGVGRVVRWGRTLAFTEGEIYDAEGRLLAKATGTAVPTPFKSYK